MTLDSIYMPQPARVEGKRVMPLGDWPQPEAEDARRARRLERYRRYAESHRAERIAYMRVWRARRKAA